MINIAILLALTTCVVALPQYGGGSAGGLLGHHQPLGHYVIGLSGGNEYEEEGGQGGQGEQGGNEGHHYQEHGHQSIGFTGSDFKTPVDVHHEHEVHIKAKPEYHYDYHVSDHKHHDFKSKHEERDGYKVKGTYSLLEPDHKTIRVVDYVSDKKSGFIAKVSYHKHH